MWNTPTYQGEREPSALLGRPTPMHSRKKLQKEKTSSLIPKKSLRGELLGEAH